MVQTRPHHVELVHQLLVQGTHLRMHQLLVDRQPHAEDVDLSADQRTRELNQHLLTARRVERIEAPPHLLLHQILQMCDPLRVLRVAADVVLIEERLLKKTRSQKMKISP